MSRSFDTDFLPVKYAGRVLGVDHGAPVVKGCEVEKERLHDRKTLCNVSGKGLAAVSDELPSQPLSNTLVVHAVLRQARRFSTQA